MQPPVKTLDFKPTPEQEAIVKAALAGGNLMVNAYAGCAKTTTLKLIANALPPIPALALAFNVKIKKELERVFPPTFTIMTLNGLGHRAWGKALGRRLTVDDRKLGRLTTEVLKRFGFKAASDQWAAVRQLASAAQKVGLVPNTFPHQSRIPDTIENWAELADKEFIQADSAILDMAREVLIDSVREAFAGIISYDDQIYMSTMFNGVFAKFPLVMVDEAQDLSPLNHIQVQRSAADRLIVVGDPKQAIYAFRGADSNSMAKLHDLRPSWVELPLATTFRCPKIVVQRQQVHAPGFTAWPTNQEGLVHTWTDREDGWSWDLLQSALPTSHAGVAILCRNNAPLLSMAFKLLRQRVPVVMLGRDIGKNLIALSKKILPRDDIPIGECQRLVTEWMDTESALAEANGKDEKVAGITDRGECLLAVIESAGITNSKELRLSLEELFSADHGRVTLSSIHRAKGLEWDVVVHLDPWRIPSKFARRAAATGHHAAMQQELNLRYVGETRTRGVLVLANAEDFQ